MGLLAVVATFLIKSVILGQVQVTISFSPLAQLQNFTISELQRYVVKENGLSKEKRFELNASPAAPRLSQVSNLATHHEHCH